MLLTPKFAPCTKRFAYSTCTLLAAASILLAAHAVVPSPTLLLFAVAAALYPACSLFVRVLLTCTARTRLVHNDAVYCIVCMVQQLSRLLWTVCLYTVSSFCAPPGPVPIAVTLLLVVQAVAAAQKAAVIHISRTTVWAAYLPRIREIVIDHEVVSALAKFCSGQHLHQKTSTLATSMYAVQQAAAMTFLDADKHTVAHDEGLYDALQQALRTEACTLPRPPDLSPAGAEDLDLDGIAAVVVDEEVCCSALPTVALQRVPHLQMAEAQELFDPEGTGSISKSAFTAALAHLSSRRACLRATVQDYERMVHTLGIALSSISCVVAFFICLLVLRVDVLQMGLSIVTLVFAFSVAFGSSLQSFFEGTVFVFTVRPFDVGDKVLIPEVQASAAGSENASSSSSSTCSSTSSATTTPSALVVRQMNLLNTVFTTTTGQYMVVANSRLAGCVIINSHRSAATQHRFTIRLPSTTPLRIVQNLNTKLQAHCFLDVVQAQAALDGSQAGSGAALTVSVAAVQTGSKWHVPAEKKQRTASQLLSVVQQYFLEEGVHISLPQAGGAHAAA